jgi:hypothetical protein
LFDLAKIAFVGLFVYFRQQDDDDDFLITAICLLMWLALSGLSLLASYGFLSQINEQYEMARLTETAIYTERQTAVEQARAKLNRLNEYANVDTTAIAAEIASVQQANQTWFARPAKNSLGQSTGQTIGQMTADCTNQNWYFNRYCQKVADNKASIQQLQARLDGYQRYQAALSHYQAAQQAFSELTGSSNHQAHPMFVNIGQLLNQSPSSVRNVYILLSSLVLELLASVLMFARYQIMFKTYPIDHKPTPKPITPSSLSIASPKTGRQIRDELLQQLNLIEVKSAQAILSNRLAIDIADQIVFIGVTHPADRDYYPIPILDTAINQRYKFIANR